MRLILVRHTPVANAAGLCYGRADLDLADSFGADAAAVRATLPPGPWAVVSSPARRCRRLAETLGPVVTLDPRLAEADFGAWDGRAWDDLPRAEVDRWCDDFVTVRPPGGESFADVAARAEAFVADMTRRHPHGTVLAVTHAGVIRALLAPRRGVAYKDAFSLAVPPGSVHMLEAAP
ncbi:MAG: alpha-ribazole phosphatase [Thermomicrobiales bacterium]